METPKATVTLPRLGWISLAAAGAAALTLASGCGSLPKDELEARLLELPKNRPLAELGLRRGSFGGGGEFVYASATATDREEAALPVVLVHATPSTLFSWSELIAGNDEFAGLAAQRDVYALEVVGHGVAPEVGGEHTFERCANYVADAVRALGLERVHLVGHSYGGEFCWRAALNAPELFASLTLMSSSGWERRDGDWLPEEEVMRNNPLAKLGWRLNSVERIETALEPHYREIPPDRAEEVFLVCSNADNWKAMVDLARDENGEREGELEAIAVPTLVLWGADDVAYPLEVYGQRFDAAIPESELVVLETTGHYAHEERPAAVSAELERFFTEQEAR